jgi:hypothetical protein
MFTIIFRNAIFNSSCILVPRALFTCGQRQGALAKSKPDTIKTWYPVKYCACSITKGLWVWEFRVHWLWKQFVKKWIMIIILNLHSGTGLSGWLRHCLLQVPIVISQNLGNMWPTWINEQHSGKSPRTRLHNVINRMTPSISCFISHLFFYCIVLHQITWNIIVSEK